MYVYVYIAFAQLEQLTIPLYIALHVLLYIFVVVQYVYFTCAFFQQPGTLLSKLLTLMYSEVWLLH